MLLEYIIGGILGIGGSIFGVVACYYAYKAAKSLGGIMGKALFNIAIGCILITILQIYNGTTLGMIIIGKTPLIFGPHSLIGSIIGAGLILLGSLFLIKGFYYILKITKPKKRKK